MKISYSVYQKNKDKGNLNYYLRVREGGKIKDIPLHTESARVATESLNKCRADLALYNSLASQDLPIPTDLATRIVHATATATPVQPRPHTRTIQNLIDEYLRSLVTSGHRETTIAVFQRAFRALLGQHTKEPISWLTESNIRAVISAYVDNHKANTRRNTANALRNLINYYSDTYDVDVRKLLKACVKVRVDEHEIHYWTESEMSRIINYAPSESAKLYFSVLASTGMRNTEAYCLEYRDLRDGAFILRAETTKGRKSRTVPLQSGLYDHLLDLSRQHSQDERIFAELPKSQPGRHSILKKTIDSINKIAGPSAQIEHAGLHQFRRSAAIMLYKRLDIKTVATILGHSAAVSLKYYQAARSATEMTEAINKALDDSDLRVVTRLDSLLYLI